MWAERGIGVVVYAGRGELGFAGERLDQRVGLTSDQPGEIGHWRKVIPPRLLFQSRERRRRKNSGTHGIREASHIPPGAGR
jgi:hypothetical protein